MARYLASLNQEITNVVELQHYVELEDMVHMAMKVERQLKRRVSSRFGVATPSGSSSPWKASERIESELQTKSQPLKKKEDVPDVVKGKLDSQTSKRSELRCFKCLERWHIASQCPNQRTTILREGGRFKSKEEANEESKQPLGDDDQNIEYLITGELIVTMRTLSV